MLFNSVSFILFFPVVVVAYFLIPYRYRWILLLAASYYFYMCWEIEYVLLIVISTVVDYFAALKMSKITEKRKRKPYLWLSILTNIGILFGFKYFNFFSDNVQAVFDVLNIKQSIPYFDVLLPVGISFYTFQTLSYTINVYQGKSEPERHFGIFAVYVSFFPQLVAGPIERAENLLPQFYKKFDFDYKRVTDGLKLMLWGFFKKMVIADNLALYVDEVYSHPEMYDSNAIILAAVFFAFQIYCDFSGYSDIAIGAAKVMGYDLMTNFNRPYIAKTVTEFWRRWHISLSTWFRDYLYIPLGGNRVVKLRWYFNLFVVFLVSGLWHGANWTFVVWGALHGLAIVYEVISRNQRRWMSEHVPSSIYSTISILLTFAFWTFSMVFFRAASLDDAIFVLENMFSRINLAQPAIAVSGFSRYNLLIAFASIGLMEWLQYRAVTPRIYDYFNRQPLLVRWTLYFVLFWSILAVGNFNTAKFIYFDF